MGPFLTYLTSLKGHDESILYNSEFMSDCFHFWHSNRLHHGVFKYKERF